MFANPDQAYVKEGAVILCLMLMVLLAAFVAMVLQVCVHISAYNGIIIFVIVVNSSNIYKL